MARSRIADRGVTGMRIDDVAERAGTSHGTLYLYFEDKDDLLDTLMADCAHELAEVAAELLLRGVTPLRGALAGGGDHA